MSISLPNIDGISKFLHYYTQQEMCSKMVVADPTTPQRRRYTTLWNISFQKLHRSKAQQRQTERARSEENATAVDELD